MKGTNGMNLMQANTNRLGRPNARITIHTDMAGRRPDPIPVSSKV